MNLKLLDRNLLVINGLLFASACVLTIGALAALPGAIKSAANVYGQSAAELPILKVESTPVPPGILSGIAARLNATYPGVNATVNGERFKVSISDPSAYSRWQAAIGDLLLSGDKNMIVETVSICGSNCSGDYCVAEFKPKHVKYFMSNP